MSTSTPSTVIYDDDVESDNATLRALSSLVQLEATCVARQGEAYEEAAAPQLPHSPPKMPAIVPVERVALQCCLDLAQKAVHAVEDALACGTRDRSQQALVRLQMRVKQEQEEKTGKLRIECRLQADSWVAVLQTVEHLGRDHPKDPQVHQLIYLVQSCVGKSAEPELPEQEEEQSCLQQDDSDDEEHAEGNDELCGRLGEAAVDVDIASDDEAGFLDAVKEEVASNQTEHDETESDHASTAVQVSCEPQLDPESIEHEGGEVDRSPSCSPDANAPAKLPALLSLTVAHPIVKSIQEPRPPRSRTSSNSSSSPGTSSNSIKSNGKNSRLKFQFPETELLRLIAEDDDDVTRASTASASSTSSRSPGKSQGRRRFSSTAAITGTISLRRKSFTMKRSPLKSASLAGFASRSTVPSFSSSSQRLSARRKSTSACYAATTLPFSRRSGKSPAKSFSITKFQVSSSKKTASSSASMTTTTTASPPTQTQTQMVLRVRERKSDGVPELVISKKPVRFVVLHWNDRCLRLPFFGYNDVSLGPAQHGVMLRQLRYVKSVMHEFPWAKAHLRALLAKYTSKEVSKEELYPQLNALGQQVQREISTKTKQHRALVQRKQQLTVTLTLATGVVNDTLVTKFGRRGRPHASRLLYDPTTPLQLRWRRKHGERSAEFLVVDEIHISEVPDPTSGAFGRGHKKVAVDPSSCLSLVTPTRSLDLQVASALHREWLANAIRDLVAFARQYKAASVGSSSDGGNTRSLVASASSIAAKRPRPLMIARHANLC